MSPCEGVGNTEAGAGRARDLEVSQPRVMVSYKPAIRSEGTNRKAGANPGDGRAGLSSKKPLAPIRVCVEVVAGLRSVRGANPEVSRGLDPALCKRRQGKQQKQDGQSGHGAILVSVSRFTEYLA